MKPNLHTHEKQNSKIGKIFLKKKIFAICPQRTSNIYYAEASQMTKKFMTFYFGYPLETPQ